MNEAINYTNAFEELQTIATEIEQGEISVDELSEKVKRAVTLIKICKGKLVLTETDVTSALKELSGGPACAEQKWEDIFFPFLS
jgi:exodeoxyribonuclease VII small subunit